MKEILTLENVQVDCRELKEEQIKEMADVFEKAGYKYFEDNKRNALVVYDDVFYLYLYENEIIIDKKEDYKTTITHDKFMELFGSDEKEDNRTVEEMFPNIKIVERPIKEHIQKPKQYQIGIDTFERCEANMTKEEILACIKFGIDKYTWRNKGQDLEDLEKIIDYANWGIKQLKQQ